MSGSANSAEELSAALLALEDQVIWDAEAAYATAVRLTQRAEALGDEPLVARARLCAATLLLRTGDIAGLAEEIYSIHEWANRHGDSLLQARTHMACANVQRLAGDMAKNLEHSLSAVELLDESATPYTQIWHRTKLADALAMTGSIDAARLRYRQAEKLARDAHEWERLRILLNNWAYAEYVSGDFASAEQVVVRVQDHAQQHGFDLDPTALDTIGAIQIANGQFAEAEATMLLCIARHESGFTDDADDLAEYLLTLARAQRGLGAIDRAQASVDASRELSHKRDLPALLVRAHQEQADLHAARGEHAEAFAMHKMFLAAQEALLAGQQQAEAQTRRAMFETAEARAEAERFREQARRDPLTGLRNRRYLDEELPALIATHPGLAVAIADIDHFKRINDQLSHDVGDQVLVQVARILDTELAVVSPDGFVARLGGEEFLLVLPATRATDVTARLDRVRQAISGHDWRDMTGELPVTVSIGVARVSENAARTQAAALAAADGNLYAAKRGGRNRVVSATEREHNPRTYRDRGVA